MTVQIIQGDCRDVLSQIESERVHCVVTSPPYWGLRDYGVAGQIGLESSLTDYVETMRKVFGEVRRVLRKDGTLWLNLGDSYSSHDPGGYREGEFLNPGGRPPTKGQARNRSGNYVEGVTRKNLLGIPWRVAFALQAGGWYLRSDIIWSKPNPMPEPVTDRPTKAHEYLFLLAKSEKYFYDAEAIKEKGSWERENNPDWQRQRAETNERKGCGNRNAKSGGFTSWSAEQGRNKRSVWEIATSPFPEAHFATFPPALIKPCILAGSSEKGCCAKCGAPRIRQVSKSGGTTGKSWHNHQNDLWRGQRGGDDGANDAAAGWKTYKVETIGWSPSCSCNAGTMPCTILDPFGGAGTTGLVADRLGRNAILIELNRDYAEMAQRRIKQDAGFFA
jgi:DNA modification methylase